MCSDNCPWTSVPRSSQFSSSYAVRISENYSLLGTDARGQISEHIFAPNVGYCLCINTVTGDMLLYSYSYHCQQNTFSKLGRSATQHHLSQGPILQLSYATKRRGTGTDYYSTRYAHVSLPQVQDKISEGYGYIL